jgi:hypothetical protein
MPWLMKLATMRGKYFYADKTELLYDLIKVESPCFFSRPRYFGKTLLVDTLEQMLKGNRELFKGLWIDGSDYDWKPRPVINLTFLAIDLDNVKSFRSDLANRLKIIASHENLNLEGSSPPELFDSLIEQFFKKYNEKIAILIDEYDTPILLNLHKPTLSKEICEYLKSFFSVLKDNDPRRGFTFITGLATFVRQSIFPALNDLVDLTMDGRYASLCGFTSEEFDSLLSDRMEPMLRALKADGTMSAGKTLSDLRELIHDWYGGYSWDGKTRVLNPSSILNGFDIALDGDYWPHSGIPLFLADLVKDGLLKSRAFQEEISIPQPLIPLELGEKLDPIKLLFQSGFLTLDRLNVTAGNKEWILKIPNLQVRALVISLFLPINTLARPFLAHKHTKDMVASLIGLDAEAVQRAFGAFLAEIPAKSHVASAAFYYALFLGAMFFAETKVDANIPEGDWSHDARYRAPDGTLFVLDIEYCPLRKPKDESDPEKDLEKKMKKAAKAAMKKIDDKNLTKPYLGSGHDIYKVALIIGGRTNVLVELKKEEQN